ncbi:hypothetical protein TcasGA2_TC009881 [Tribolium castaneum]|uniref:DUF1917 domain-containing protein n=1 Tax=Tribolium castaneum TaxID=7070 RepID=D6WQ69_TRICA|nr:PREDICTED: uncharacterized protein LOC103313666 [Tribolium castaneum]EFA06931.1 hypothetical protein TcasGA2_TC009881 [Tribolium castaneum]|eukprot:XP_008195747.1 PREDICTED: uncharacterized protein LOC103313666 [Tribolium castaneum]
MDAKFVFKCDVASKEIKNDCTLNPTDVTKGEAPWLWAKNNKYSLENVNGYCKVGKWMLFLSKADVNGIWTKIKEAVKTGDLWDAKVSTSADSEPLHAVIIYTKDYTDLDDVISVLDFLETSDIKPQGEVIRYKTDKQTGAGIYSRFNQKASIYDSKTIRQLKNNKRITDYFKPI